MKSMSLGQGEFVLNAEFKVQSAELGSVCE